MTKSLRRQLEALRRALASRPPKPPKPPGPSINEELSRYDPIRIAGVLAVMHRSGLLDRFCDACDDGPWVDEPQTRSVWAAFSGGERMPWDVCATFGIELDALERHTYEEPKPAFPEPELWEDDTGQSWRVRYCKRCDRARSTRPDGADDVWIEPEWKTEKPSDSCVKCGRELSACEPATRD